MKAINLSGGNLSPDSLMIKRQLEDIAYSMTGRYTDVPFFVPPQSKLEEYMGMDLDFIEVDDNLKEVR